MDLGQNAQDAARTHGVGAVGQRRLGQDGGQGAGLGAGGRGIDEDDLLAPNQVQGMLDLELEVGEQVAIGQAALGLALGQPFQ